MLLPKYFYDLKSILPDGMPRWADEFTEFSSPSLIEPVVLNKKEMFERNLAYSKWLAAFFVKKDGQFYPLLKPKIMKWQAIRILTDKHSESSKDDWWQDYQDAVFRVFIQPETVYNGKDFKQWYLLSPEDGYLVNLREIQKKAPGLNLPQRERNGREKYLSAYNFLRCARIVPVECCHHLRNETTGGQLPAEL